MSARKSVKRQVYSVKRWIKWPLAVTLYASLLTIFGYTAAQAATADADFQARCSAAGVLTCQGFDDPAIFSSVVNEAARTDGFGKASHPNLTQDASVYLSGGNSANFFIPAGASENDTGNWWSFFGQGPNNQFFGQNSDFYVQYAFRADSTWTSTNWTLYGGSGSNTSPKLSIFHNVIAGSCAIEEITTHNHNGKDLPTIYTNCGSPQAVTGSDGVTYNENGSLLYFQQGWTEPAPFTGYQCEYNNGSFSGLNCFHFTANQWYTLYFHVHVGTWGTANSTLEAWVAPYGQQFKKWINVHNYPLSTESLCDGTPNDSGQGNQPCHGFDVLELTQFMTAKIAGTGPAAHVWYDELIVSSQPIAQPGGTPPSSSPCDVNGDGVTNVADVQLEVNMALGISPCTNASGVCTVVSVQRVVNAALGGACVSP